MLHRTARLVAPALLLASFTPSLIAQEAADKSAERNALIHEALTAATPAIAMGATVVDWEQNVLREGDNGWTCFPTPPQLEKAPMCLDGPSMGWAEAWMNKKPFSSNAVGIAYMLAGDSGASNSDPYAEGETDDWVVAGPHLMVITPDNAGLDGVTTDPKSGGPWVMWKGTPYAHIMVPVPGQPGMHGCGCMQGGECSCPHMQGGECSCPHMQGGECSCPHMQGGECSCPHMHHGGQPMDECQ